MNATSHPAVTAALRTAATLLGMEVVFISNVTLDKQRIELMFGEWDGMHEGDSFPREDGLCHRMLSGAPSATNDAANDPAYRDAPGRIALGVTSYVGVPVLDAAGAVLGTLCGIDHRSIVVDESRLTVLKELAKVIGAHLTPLSQPGMSIVRTEHGWEVAGEDTPSLPGQDDLLSAMVLADLLHTELEPAGRPPRVEGELDEVAQLRLSVTQLEHALAARVVVEQSIGVLAERMRTPPRTAFEKLRRAARSRGRKVHELAREVVASVTDRAVPLPPELAPPRR